MSCSSEEGSFVVLTMLLQFVLCMIPFVFYQVLLPTYDGGNGKMSLPKIMVASLAPVLFWCASKRCLVLRIGSSNRFHPASQEIGGGRKRRGAVKFATTASPNEILTIAPDGRRSSGHKRRRHKIKNGAEHTVIDEPEDATILLLLSIALFTIPFMLYRVVHPSASDDDGDGEVLLKIVVTILSPVFIWCSIIISLFLRMTGTAVSYRKTTSRIVSCNNMGSVDDGLGAVATTPRGGGIRPIEVVMMLGSAQPKSVDCFTKEKKEKTTKQKKMEPESVCIFLLMGITLSAIPFVLNEVIPLGTNKEGGLMMAIMSLVAPVLLWCAIMRTLLLRMEQWRL